MIPFWEAPIVLGPGDPGWRRWWCWSSRRLMAAEWRCFGFAFGGAGDRVLYISDYTELLPPTEALLKQMEERGLSHKRCAKVVTRLQAERAQLFRITARGKHEGRGPRLHAARLRPANASGRARAHVLRVEPQPVLKADSGRCDPCHRRSPR